MKSRCRSTIFLSRPHPGPNHHLRRNALRPPAYHLRRTPEFCLALPGKVAACRQAHSAQYMHNYIIQFTNVLYSITHTARAANARGSKAPTRNRQIKGGKCEDLKD